MLIEMESRGPDSAGVAVYRNKVKSGQTKLSLSHFDENFSWEKLAGNLVSSLDCHVSFSQVSTHCILITDASESEVIEWLQNKYFDVRIFGSGELIEIYKEVGSPESVFEKFDLELASGSHMIGHTRMATESIVDTAGFKCELGPAIVTATNNPNATASCGFTLDPDFNMAERNTKVPKNSSK